MQQRTQRWRGAVVVSVVAVAMALLAPTVTPARAADLRGSFSGNAYGTSANVEAGAVATELGRSAFQPCPCRGTDGEVLTNRVDSLRAGDDGEVLKADTTAKKKQVIRELERMCAEELPEYVQPVAYKFIPSMPMTPVGKVDYRQLEADISPRDY